MDRSTFQTGSGQPLPRGASSLTTKRIMQLFELWDDEDQIAERVAASQRLELARGDQNKYIRPMPAEPPDHFKDKPKFAPGVLKQALRELSYLYDEEPLRTLEDAAAEEWAERAVWRFGMGLSTALAHAHSLSRLTGNVLGLVVHKLHPDAALNYGDWLHTKDTELGEEPPEFPADSDGFEVIPITRNRFEVLHNRFDERLISACIVLLSRHKNGASYTERFAYWDNTMFAVISRESTSREHTVLSVEEHKRGAMPVVPLRFDEGSSTWHNPLGLWGGEDLFAKVQAISEIFTEYLWTAKLQRGQPWIQGDSKNLGLAPDHFIKLRNDANFGIAQNGANLAGMWEAIENALGSLAKDLGLPSKSLSISYDSAASGIAIALDREELRDDRRSQEKNVREWERKILSNCARQAEARGLGIFDVSNFSIEYREPPLRLTEDQKITRLKFEVENGLATREDLVRELHPHLTEDQIAARLEAVDKVKAENEAKMEAKMQKAAEKKKADDEAEAEKKKASEPRNPFDVPEPDDEPDA